MKKFIKELIPYIVIILSVVLIRTFVATPVRVDGKSMDPTLSNNEILMLNKFDKTYKRFDIIVFNYNSSKLVKRIIGLPGDKIEYIDDKLYINGEEIKEPYKRKKMDNYTSDVVPNNMYFVMGDNRGNSLDSRYIGSIRKEDIEGTVKLSILPPKILK